MNTAEQNIMIAILGELKKMNENIEIYTEIQLSHYISVGEMEMEEISDSLDS